ncbi:MAG: AAA family ATPase [Lachnospiraceae bacterium]|nr:AAA family ATPase [Lachnospiraceae bacterium]
MGKIISITNQKGGVGKTTSSINLSAAIAATGKKVLVVDADPQGNTTSGLGVEKNTLEDTLYELMIGDSSTEECIIKNVCKNLDLIPANVNLAAAEIEILQEPNNQFILKKALDWVRDKYDFIIIDCPPSLSTLTVNALSASNSVLVPIQCEYFALEGLTSLINTVNLVKERLNHDIDMEGVFFTMYDARTKLSEEVVADVKQKLRGYTIFNSIIPTNVRLAEAPSQGMPINEYDPTSTGAKAYESLAREIIKNNRK